MSTDQLSAAPQPQPLRPSMNPAHRRRRRIGLVMVALGLAILAAVGWVSWRAYQAYDALSRAAVLVSEIQAEVKDVATIDVDTVRAHVADLQVQSQRAIAATSDPIYRMATVLPWIGTNLDAVGAIASVADNLADRTAPLLLDAADTVRPSNLAPKDGQIDIARISKAEAGLQEADAAVESAQERISGLQDSELIGPVASAATDLRHKLTSLRSTTEAAARISRLVPPMLGATGPRKYLVVFQNLAEPRASGGIFGSYVLLTVDQGKLSLSGQGSSSRDLGEFHPPVTLPTTMPVQLYGALPGIFPTDVNFTPDFPSSASLISQMYQRRTGTTVDGVLSIDPVALSYLMVGRAPVDIGKGIQLTSANLTEVLLSKAYVLYPKPADAKTRDKFLSQATSSVFAAVTGSAPDASTLMRGLIKATGERRVSLWSAHPGEQTDIGPTVLAGMYPTASTAPQFGVFRNDGTGGKLGYYATGSVSMNATGCTAEGRRTIALHLSMTYAPPSGPLPAYVLGLQLGGPRVLRTNVLVLAPPDAKVESIDLDGKAPSVLTVSGQSTVASTVTIDLRPGTTARLTVSLTIPNGAPFKATAVMTPGVTPWPVSDADIPTCGG